MPIGTRRLAKERIDLQNSDIPGISVIAAEDLQEWTFCIQVLGETPFAGEQFALRFKFPPEYPIKPPEVTFLVSEKWQAPMHPHVYSNGHICASILSEDGWSPVLTASKVCLSLQSMLASCKSKERPPDNDQYVKTARSQSPKHTRFVYHDDNV